MKGALLIIPAVIIFSCSGKVSENKGSEVEEKKDIDKNKLELVQIHFGPLYHSPSVITYNIPALSILFQPNFMTNNITPPVTEQEFVVSNKYAAYVPHSSYYKISFQTFNFIHDSVLGGFNEKDYMSYEGDEKGEIGEYIVFAFNNDSIVECSLKNMRTRNQYLFITKLIDVCIESEKDSINIEYLNSLKEYY